MPFTQSEWKCFEELRLPASPALQRGFAKVTKTRPQIRSEKALEEGRPIQYGVDMGLIGLIRGTLGVDVLVIGEISVSDEMGAEVIQDGEAAECFIRCEKCLL
jgi:hypothetical protein